MAERHYFHIAEHYVCLCFEPSERNNMGLLPSFSAFRCEEVSNDKLFFSLTVDDSLQPRKDSTLVRTFDTGNGDTVVYQLSDGGYQYIIRDVSNRDCALLVCNKDFSLCSCALNGDWVMRSFGLNDALMLVYAFAGSFRQTLLMHASCILYNGYGYPFTAKSGTGKSTHTSLWMKHIMGAELMNDDNPIIRIINGQPYIYGSPWSGKTPCYRNVKARLGAITQIERAPRNYVERMKPIAAFTLLLPACSSMKWDSEIYNLMCDCITRLIETTPIYTLYCLPDEEAARVCHHALTSDKSDNKLQA